jgi:hypothetical protein
MSIDNLFRQLKDIQFQADKILKAKQIEDEAIAKFANYAQELKSSLINIEVNDDLALHVNDIEVVDPNYDPKPPIVVALVGALSFGIASKKYRRKKREEYFRNTVKNTKDQFSHIDFLLKEI